MNTRYDARIAHHRRAAVHARAEAASIAAAGGRIVVNGRPVPLDAAMLCGVDLHELAGDVLHPLPDERGPRTLGEVVKGRRGAIVVKRRARRKAIATTR